MAKCNQLTSLPFKRLMQFLFTVLMLTTFPHKKIGLCLLAHMD